jgi:hypothetical protein
MLNLRSTFVAIYLAVVVSCISVSLYFVWNNYFITPHWDQWEFFRALTADPHQVNTLRFIFRPHNEHVMFSSKLLFLLDLSVFNATNIAIVGVTLLLNLLIAYTLAAVAFPDPLQSIRYLAFGAFAVSALSLAQWENLLWAFQTEFSVMCLASLLTIVCLVAWIDAREPTSRIKWLAALYASLFFTILSLGNGPAIVVPIILIMLALRQPIKYWMTILIAYFVVTGWYFWLGRAGHAVGDASLRTAANYALFFAAVVGSPVSPSERVAVTVGAIYVVFFVGIFVWAIFLPWWRRDYVNRSTLQLVALGLFLLATSAAIAWGRVPLGLPSAMASRYSTPVLWLWMAGIAAAARYAIASQPQTSAYRLVPTLWILLALGVAVISSLRPLNFTGMEYFSTRIRQAAYFIASGVFADEQLSHLYPSPAAIRPTIEFLRQHRLNIFAENFGLATPSADLATPARSSPYQACTLIGVDAVRRLGGYGWEIVGWVAHPTTKAAPDWIIALDKDRRLRGFTRPLTRRPDVIAVIGAPRSFRGFIVPVAALGGSNRADSGDDLISLFVVFSDGARSCLLDLPQPLPLN